MPRVLILQKGLIMRITVTLGRQLGCGGSYLGQCVADALQIRCLDREIVSKAAQNLHCDEDELLQREERGASFWERMLRGITTGPPEALYQAPVSLSVTDRDLLAAETEVMREIAAQEDVVIVGRIAAYVLPPHPGMVNVFLHAPSRFRVHRLVASGHAATESEAKTLIARSDETRRQYISQMTGKEEYDARHYHLCLDTSLLPLPDTAALLTDFVRRRTAEQRD
jgi:cytidylate kinase